MIQSNLDITNYQINEVNIKFGHAPAKTKLKM